MFSWPRRRSRSIRQKSINLFSMIWRCLMDNLSLFHRLELQYAGNVTRNIIWSEKSSYMNLFVLFTVSLSVFYRLYLKCHFFIIKNCCCVTLNTFFLFFCILVFVFLADSFHIWQKKICSYRKFVRHTFRVCFFVFLSTFQVIP